MSLFAAWLTTFGVCLLGSVIPIFNTEIYLLSASALAPPAFVLPLVIAATLGQMVGKVAMFYAARGAIRIPSEWLQRRLEAAQTKMDERPNAGKLILFSSASIGLPPLYVTTLACGAVRMGIVPFIVLGTAGRFVHFLVVAAVPQLVKAFWT